MRIIGERVDGAVALNVGVACFLLKRDQAGDRVSSPLDLDTVETFGPWAPVPTTLDVRRAVEKRLDAARVAPLAFFAPTLTQDAAHRNLWLSVKDRLDLKDAAPEHPFTHCREVIIPAMEAEGKAPDDPDAFCAWWKAEHGG